MTDAAGSGEEPGIRLVPFQSMDEIDEYLGGELIQCLECGKLFRFLTGKHLRLIHGMTSDEYRLRWGIPKTYGLSGRAYSRDRSEITRRMAADGVLTYDHLASASNPASRAPMSPRVPADSARQSTFAKSALASSHNQIPTGGKRADGRSAERTREYQRAYRALKKGDPLPMERYRAQFQGGPGT